jgi:hypothetical protein
MPSPRIVSIPGISRDGPRPTNGMKNISVRRIRTMDEEEEILAHYCTYGSMFYIYNTRTLGLAGEVQPPCNVPPLDYKRDGTFNTGGHSHSSVLDTSPPRPKLSQALSNTTHIGVGYYTSVARTTLNTCMFLCSSISSAKP